MFHASGLKEVTDVRPVHPLKMFEAQLYELLNRQFSPMITDVNDEQSEKAIPPT
jgi:hypothetical protein